MSEPAEPVAFKKRKPRGNRKRKRELAAAAAAAEAAPETETAEEEDTAAAVAAVAVPAETVDAGDEQEAVADEDEPEAKRRKASGDGSGSGDGNVPAVRVRAVGRGRARRRRQDGSESESDDVAAEGDEVSLARLMDARNVQKLRRRTAGIGADKLAVKEKRKGSGAEVHQGLRLMKYQAARTVSREASAKATSKAVEDDLMRKFLAQEMRKKREAEGKATEKDIETNFATQEADLYRVPTELKAEQRVPLPSATTLDTGKIESVELPFAYKMRNIEKTEEMLATLAKDPKAIKTTLHTGEFDPNAVGYVRFTSTRPFEWKGGPKGATDEFLVSRMRNKFRGRRR